MRDRLVMAIGAEATDTLMDHLPPVGWADVARRSDVEDSARLLRADIDREFTAVRSEMATEFAAVRTEMASLRAATADLGGQLRSEMAQQTRTIMFGTMAALGTTIAAMAAAAGTFAALAH